jgi:hypothetical protein
MYGYELLVVSSETDFLILDHNDPNNDMRLKDQPLGFVQMAEKAGQLIAIDGLELFHWAISGLHTISVPRKRNKGCCAGKCC